MAPWVYLVQYYGSPAVIGIVLGYVLLGTRVRGPNGNILGVEPWDPVRATLTGGIVFGAIFWYLVFR